ncbi:hypothetical protein F2Q69_00022826 [Brassica cretica]|uniref:Uncharacterized protein n=1 Tax=Brassica cretica TaxID=69181 RepID=A0A8S9QTY6_BRACR|nr:hypothetical protein F2Q69_00022826 [Brassica cretica]
MVKPKDILEEEELRELMQSRGCNPMDGTHGCNPVDATRRYNSVDAEQSDCRRNPVSILSVLTQVRFELLIVHFWSEVELKSEGSY